MTTVTAFPAPSALPAPPPPPQGGESYRLAVPNTANAPRIARDFVGSLLRVGRHSALVDDARLCITEIVTNAHRHTRTRQIRIDVTINRKQVTVSVTDDKPWALPMPQNRGQAQEFEDGQGLHLVDTLARAWGTTIYGACSPRAKAVWFMLARSEVAEA
ncbi:ATP-binding protein [Streptomyces sp. NPDC101062]|uniref:ATP-binding protein n=1 Tax=unclassified Streptomyces TaxID=2593676 RepID=UPI002E7AA18C|nr:ATP-binding protein [Streptomyces sp. JV176]MEE1800342.1 ATP-binding protein [Streptomyces sp. JV176]